MTPKEKAEKLVDKHLMILANVWDSLRTKEDMAKQCALICVNEKIKTASKGILPSEFPTKEVLKLREVKQEIEKQV